MKLDLVSLWHSDRINFLDFIRVLYMFGSSLVNNILNSGRFYSEFILVLINNTSNSKIFNIISKQKMKLSICVICLGFEYLFRILIQIFKLSIFFWIFVRVQIDWIWIDPDIDPGFSV